MHLYSTYVYIGVYCIWAGMSRIIYMTFFYYEMCNIKMTIYLLRGHMKFDCMHTGFIAIRVFNRGKLFLIHQLFLNSKAIDRFSINAWENLSANNYFQALHSIYVICYLCNDIIELFDVAKKMKKESKTEKWFL